MYERPRYRCYPDDPDEKIHRFTGIRHRRTADHPAGQSCSECEATPVRDEGPLIAWNWDFAAREIAEALLLVGRGLSYRKTAAQLRLNARRYKVDAGDLPVPSRYGGTVARYIDVFGPKVVDAVSHDRWPRILLLDALPVRARVLDEDGNKQKGGEALGAFLFASGYTEPVPQSLRPQRVAEGDAVPWRLVGPKRHPHLWHVEVAGGLDTASWRNFLDQLDGEPEWVVTDGDDAVKAAVRDKWGDRPVLYSCEGHLLLNFKDAAKADGWAPVKAETLFGDAFNNPDEWRAFIGRLFSEPGKVANIAAWVGRRNDLVLKQMALRRRGFPRGIGAMEASIKQAGEWIGDRRKVFQNVRRIDLTLALMRAQIAGHADVATYARAIREELVAVGGRPDIDWRKHHDKHGRRGLYALVDDAASRREAHRTIATVSAKNRSIEAKILLGDAFRATLGMPPFVINRGARTISVRTRGQRLADRPEIARELDLAIDGDALEEPASSARVVAWTCALDPEHRWPAPIGQRCMRLTGCPTHAREAQSAGKGRRLPSKSVKVEAAA